MHGYRLHQMQGNGIYGFRKSGYLLKKSEGKMGVKVWRKRRCEIKDGFLFIYHSDEAQQPAKLNLLTCQVKLVPGKEKKCFDLISFNRTYHFQVEDEHDITAWVYVLINCKEGALKKQFDESDEQNLSLTTNNNNGGSKDFVDFPNDNQHIQQQQQAAAALHRLGAEHQIQKQLIRQVQALNGNNRCVDCSTTKESPTWLSTNLGVLVCIECSGIHRDLGVHISRIQSLTLDNISTSQLLIAHNMGNEFFNEVFEFNLRQDITHESDVSAGDISTNSVNASVMSPFASLTSPSPLRHHQNQQRNHDHLATTPLKLKPNSTMEERCEFIKAKYLKKKFCQKIYSDNMEKCKCLLKEAVINKDLKLLLQLFGEGFDIGSFCNIRTLVDEKNLASHTQQQQQDIMETSIHLALSCQAASNNLKFECDLFILDFIIQNSRAINIQNSHGETPLHYCVKYNLPESMKLLLRSGADVNIKDSQTQSPVDLLETLQPKGYQQLANILAQV